MLNEITNTLKSRMEEYLFSILDLPDSPVQVGGIPFAGEDEPNKIVLSLVNLERETTMGMNSTIRPGNTDKELVRQLPPWYLNIDLLVASVYENKLYTESLKMLSLAIGYLQSVSSVNYADKKYFTIEMITFDWQELMNLWSMFGGRYYPSVVCKIRMLVIDGNEIYATMGKVSATDGKVKINSN